MRLIEDPAQLTDASLLHCSFVPTMGALHAGHGSLVTRAMRDGRPVVVSIFVNPTQFGPNEDYARYPRTLEEDCRLLTKAGATAVFVPSVEAVYPRGLEAARAESAAMLLPPVATEPRLEDASRPGHFGGVALVVARLFELVLPQRAYFGEKDYQQLRLIEEMVSADSARFGELSIVRCETVRQDDGLAMSSRNRYLTQSERGAAVALSRALRLARGAQTVAHAEQAMLTTLERAGVQIEYAVVRDAETLLPVVDSERPARALIAGKLGETRLIDNCALERHR